jgi:hypothetical protein
LDRLYLHYAAQKLNLDLEFFTMLSSISGVVGPKGQANHFAAIAFLDLFALYRQSLGLAGNSTNLGVIEDVGYVAEQGGYSSTLTISCGPASTNARCNTFSSTQSASGGRSGSRS